mgnify:CR=1 FL=1
MVEYACLKTLQTMVNNAHKERLREVKMSIRFLKQLNEALMSLLINQASDYMKRWKKQNQKKKRYDYEFKNYLFNRY